jgi:hypothetical protein
MLIWAGSVWYRMAHMKRVTLRARFGGQYVRLDEPFELEPDTALIVTVLPAAQSPTRMAPGPCWPDRGL